ncbi:MAG: acyl-CoA desaturase [Pseudomonadota bacterium]|nr:acyl-CoA desaturase [Pseudomonadota bacterium]
MLPNLSLPTKAQLATALHITPFLLMHLACLGVIWVGVSPIAVLVCAVMYGLRMFSITAFYHRYFSHKAFKTSRAVQFIFAIIGASSTQKGPLWWAAHHRHHHRHSDTKEDQHSPLHGFFQSHVGWFLQPRNFSAPYDLIKDFARFPELRWLDRNHVLIPVFTGAALYVLGSALAAYAPSLETNGFQMLVWGFFISTVLSTHITLMINSLAHVWGSRRYNTKDHSRNNWLLALLTFGEGWHNNHHFFPASARQGFFWWEIDLSYYVLKAMSAVGLIWDVKPVHQKAYQAVHHTTPIKKENTL